MAKKIKKKASSEAEEIIDPTVQNWVDNYDIKIDVDDALSFTNKIAEETCNQIVKSVCKKVGILTGISLAGNVLKYQLGMEDIDINSEEVIKTIKELSDLEMNSIAIGSTNFSKENKLKLLNICLEKFKQELPKNKNTAEVFKEHLDNIYKKYGELPNPDFNKVEMVKDKQVAARPPFGRKAKND